MATPPRLLREAVQQFSEWDFAALERGLDKQPDLPAEHVARLKEHLRALESLNKLLKSK